MDTIIADDSKYLHEEVGSSVFSLDAVQAFFCVGVFISVLRTYRPLVKFYQWFVSSGFEFSRHRGYGQTACKAYGFLPAPLLSVCAMRASGIILMICLFCLSGMSFWKLAPISAVSEDQPASENMSGILIPGIQLLLFLVSGISYHFYLSSLYCEAHVGAHVTVFLPAFIFLFACYHAATVENFLRSGSNIENDRKTQVLFAFLLKVLIASAYCGAGISKLSSTTLKTKKNGKKSLEWWWGGNTLQACIYEALFLSGNDNFPKHTSFGVPTPYSHAVQKFAFRRPRLLCFMSVFSVVFEAVAPIILLVYMLPSTMSIVMVATNVAFGVCGLGFHYGIAMLQNVDFVSWWGPAYGVFFFDPAGAKLEMPDLRLGLSNYAIMAAYMYVAGHLAFLIILRFTNVEMIPYSAFKMFCDLKNIFDPSKKKWMWLSDKEHATGTLKNYCFPFCRPQHVRPSELNSLDYAYLAVGTGGIANNEANSGTPLPVYVTVNGATELMESLNSQDIRREKKQSGIFEQVWDKITEPLKQPLLAGQPVPEGCATITIHTNVRLTVNMYRLLYCVHEQGMRGADTWKDQDSIEGALKLVEDLRAEFRKCERLPLAKADSTTKLMGA